MGSKNHGKPHGHALMGPPVEVRPVTDIKTPEELLLHCMPTFGAGFIRRIFTILDHAIGAGVPLIISVAGPVTVSNQHRAWLNPLLETGWVAYITTTDAACYHDGHDSLQRFKQRPIREVAIEGRDEEYRQGGIIRVTDAGFPEQILFDQDALVSAILRQPELQHKMTGTELRHHLGRYYAAQEQAHGVAPGLLSTCYRYGIPIFVGAPGDGSVFLNSVKLWALQQLGHVRHDFDIDLHAEVFESCAYHYWGLKHGPRQLAILILGGGVPKNFSLQPEPTLSQIFLLPGIQGYDFDVQIVGAPVTDGSLTSCKPSEAHTWGKVSLEALRSTTESFQTDYSTVMPLIAWALLDKRRRFAEMRDKMGARALYARHPEAKGYLRPSGQLRLFERRAKLVVTLLGRIAQRPQLTRIERTLNFPLQLLERAAPTP